MPINEYKIKFTPVAEEDLDQIYEYIVNKLFAQNAANDLIEKIETGIVNETEKQVIIMRILYGARDYENLM